MGQRLIKQTVLFDGRYAHYHFYYANANAEVGSVMTTFPYKRVPGRPGSGQIQSTVVQRAGGDAETFRVDHLKRHNIENSGAQERFGRKFVRSAIPPVCCSRCSRSRPMRAGAGRRRKTAGQLPVARVLRDRAVGAPVRRKETGPDRGAPGSTRQVRKGPDHQDQVNNGGASRTVTCITSRIWNQGSWGFGAGCGHHMALEVESDEKARGTESAGRRARLNPLYRDQGSQRLPLNLLPCAGRYPGRSARPPPRVDLRRDEPWEELGMNLLLPPWFEHQRAEIIKMLEPITVPEENIPLRRPGSARRQAAPGLSKRRRKAARKAAEADRTGPRRVEAHLCRLRRRRQDEAVNLAETRPSRAEAQRAGLRLDGRERLPEETLDIADRLNIDRFRWVAPAADGGTWYL